MRLMANDAIEKRGRFGTRRATLAPSPAVAGYGRVVLERLARHVCRIAGVEGSCLFVRHRSDPRLLIAAAGHGVSWELIGSCYGADEGVVGQVLVSGQPAL